MFLNHRNICTQDIKLITKINMKYSMAKTYYFIICYLTAFIKKTNATSDM